MMQPWAQKYVMWRHVMSSHATLDNHEHGSMHSWWIPYLCLWLWAGCCCVLHHHRYQRHRRSPVLELGSVCRGIEPGDQMNLGHVHTHLGHIHTKPDPSKLVTHNDLIHPQILKEQERLLGLYYCYYSYILLLYYIKKQRIYVCWAV